MTYYNQDGVNMLQRMQDGDELLGAIKITGFDVKTIDRSALTQLTRALIIDAHVMPTSTPNKVDDVQPNPFTVTPLKVKAETITTAKITANPTGHIGKTALSIFSSFGHNIA
jgi:hypothetical protein